MKLVKKEFLTSYFTLHVIFVKLQHNFFYQMNEENSQASSNQETFVELQENIDCRLRNTG